MKKTIIFIIFIFAMIFLFYNISYSMQKNVSEEKKLESKYAVKTLSLKDTPKTIINKVNFISQAPLGKWSDPRQQDGCEEAVSIMANYWQNNKSLTPKEAEQKIIAISNWEKKQYKEYRDTSVKDTANRILKGYLKTNYTIKNNVNSDDIINELSKGNIIITPMNGQKLKNPNFKGAGPINHMILIIGYNYEKKQFITNDPGTSKGKEYAYSKKIIEDSLRDYPTGYHLPVKNISRSIIVVSKK